MKILFDKVPAFANIAASEDREKCSITLGQLSGMHFIPHDPKALEDAISQICRLSMKFPDKISGIFSNFYELFFAAEAAWGININEYCSYLCCRTFRKDDCIQGSVRRT